jgi:uncharacterized protein YggE
METLEENKKRMFRVLMIFVLVLSIFYVVKIYSELKKDSMLGESTTPATISFSGHGEVTAVPDIASVYFTISKDAGTVKDAQAGVAVIEKNALDVLKAKGVADKDIQTANASFYPKYQYRQAVCPPTPVQPLNAGTGTASPNYIVNPINPIYCPSGKQVLVGYTASESITVKVRNTDTVGDIMQSLGTTGVTNLNGPDFTIDNPDALQVQAREKAIAEAKTKAETLANDLGVHLGKIASFNESGGNPIMYAKADSYSMGAVPSAAPAVIPKGQNTITSDVTITYEIK